MALPAYTQRFWLGVVAADGGTITSDPVPTGYRWVMKAITGVQTGSAGGYLELQAPGDDSLYTWHLDALEGVVKDTLEVVLEAGETFTLTNYLGASDFSGMIVGFALYVNP